MARNNKEGQSKRSRVGTAFQERVYNDLERTLEDEGLDSEFTVVNRGRKSVALSDGKTISPDIAIVPIGTDAPRVYFGCKVSFRERWKQDDRDAMLCDLPWIEITESEKSNSSLEDTRKYCAKILGSSSFAMVVSTRDADKMNEMRKYLVAVLRGA